MTQYLSLFKEAQWIWLNQPSPIPNQWVNIRKCIQCKNVDPQAAIYISVDTDYCLYINGSFVAGGAFRDYPREKTFDTINIAPFLRKGTNCIAILAWYQGHSTSHYREGMPGILFAGVNGSDHFQSDRSWQIRQSPACLSGMTDLVTVQHSFTMHYNAAKEDNWTQPDYEASGWQPATEIAGPQSGYWQSLSPRPLKKLSILEPCPTEIIQSGTFKRTKEYDSYARTVANDNFVTKDQRRHVLSAGTGENANGVQLSDDGSGGMYALVDLGRQEVGFITLDLYAARGTVIDIAHGEHIEDGRVRAWIDGRNFADRYICKQGRQQWTMPMRRTGTRYIELHITNAGPDGVQLFYAGLIPVSYPLEPRGEFQSSHSLHNQIYEVAVRTLRLCMFEHYEDSPWREQSLYAMDARNQALLGYLAFGEYDFPRVSFDLLGRSVREDGYLELCAPAQVPLTIPSFSMIWISTIWEHYLHSGQKELVTKFYPLVQKMIQGWTDSLNPDGILPNLCDESYWNFYEWSKNLDGGGPFHKDPPGKIDSCLNLFFIEALTNASQIAIANQDPASANNYAALADKIRIALRQFFVDDHSTRICDSVTPHPAGYSQLTHALAMGNGVFEPGQHKQVCEKLISDSSLVPATLSMLGFVYRALLDTDKEYAPFILKDIQDKWGYMLSKGATSFWETIKGADDFDGAGSLCHGWSALPIWFYQSILLGVRPQKPGWKEFTISPQTCGLDHLSGKVPTPYGVINIHVRRYGDISLLDISYPQEIECRYELDNTLRLDRESRTG